MNEFIRCLSACWKEPNNLRALGAWERVNIKDGWGRKDNEREKSQAPEINLLTSILLMTSSACGVLAPFRSSKTGSTQLRAGYSCPVYIMPCNDWLGLIKYNAQPRPIKFHHKRGFNQSFISLVLWPKKTAFVCHIRDNGRARISLLSGVQQANCPQTTDHSRPWERKGRRGCMNLQKCSLLMVTASSV